MQPTLAFVPTAADFEDDLFTPSILTFRDPEIAPQATAVPMQEPEPDPLTPPSPAPPSA